MPPPREHAGLPSPNEGSRYCRLVRQRQNHSGGGHTANAGTEIIAVMGDSVLGIGQGTTLPLNQPETVATGIHRMDFTNAWEQSLSGKQSRGTVRRLLKTLPSLSGSHP
jgi:hypothetical protein